MFRVFQIVPFIFRLIELSTVAARHIQAFKVVKNRKLIYEGKCCRNKLIRSSRDEPELNARIQARSIISETAVKLIAVFVRMAYFLEIMEFRF